MLVLYTQSDLLSTLDAKLHANLFSSFSDFKGLTTGQPNLAVDKGNKLHRVDEQLFSARFLVSVGERCVVFAGDVSKPDHFDS